ncbi:ACT domain-containing protein [Methanococcus voltae]|uniref:ACT domain-containing protein n=1 Tax=Methanococcus voltae TaxID=2188 RepID=UPI001AE83488|nr:ACT domain-containing protein [Methanococcus voltae]MBP2144177.1 ACT domain-containing protein [Methanococcus voltae]
MENVVITVIGLDKPGIVAGITKIIADSNSNIVDIKQTIMQDLFTMIMMIDIESSNKQLSELKEELEKLGAEINVKITVQHENIFKYMHRL